MWNMEQYLQYEVNRKCWFWLGRHSHDIIISVALNSQCVHSHKVNTMYTLIRAATSNYAVRHFQLKISIIIVCWSAMSKCDYKYMFLCSAIFAMNSIYALISRSSLNNQEKFEIKQHFKTEYKATTNCIFQSIVEILRSFTATIHLKPSYQRLTRAKNFHFTHSAI